jgi:NAD(P)-dependent dehydrogenase (short-subunit alcohol dehydrogenase family)
MMDTFDTAAPDLVGKKALITGGTGGLGPAVVTEARRRGALVTLSSVDATDEAAVAATISAIGDLQILIHLVGGYAMGPTATFDLAAYHKQIEINLTTTFVLCKHALAAMQRGGYGRIVTVGSRTAVEGGAKQAAYAAAKAGVIALTRAIADETKGTNVTANCVVPSMIDTPANRGAMPKADTARWVTPEALAGVICFLAGEAAGRLRGAAIPVYGDL